MVFITIYHKFSAICQRVASYNAIFFVIIGKYTGISWFLYDCCYVTWSWLLNFVHIQYLKVKYTVHKCLLLIIYTLLLKYEVYTSLLFLFDNIMQIVDSIWNTVDKTHVLKIENHNIYHSLVENCINKFFWYMIPWQCILVRCHLVKFSLLKDISYTPWNNSMIHLLTVIH